MKTITIEDLIDYYEHELPQILEKLNLINVNGLEYLPNFNDSLIIEVENEKLRVIANSDY